MERIRKTFNYTPIIYLISLILIATSIGLTAAKSTNTSTMEQDGVAVARFHIAFDGLETNTITSKIRATSKVTDITESNGIYYGNSFIEGAYNAYSVVVASLSNVKSDLEISVSNVTNDDRLFYIILPDCPSEQEIYELFYNEFHGTNPTLSDIRDFCNSYNTQTYTLGFEEEKRFTFIVWSEHDAVYVDSNNDGVVDTNDLVFGDTNKDGVIDALDSPPTTTFLSDLVDGVPSDTYTINYTVVQKD